MFPDRYFRRILKISAYFYPTRKLVCQKIIMPDSGGLTLFLTMYISDIHYFIIIILSFLPDLSLPVHKIPHVFDEALIY
jgi:hypothetical protein